MKQKIITSEKMAHPIIIEKSLKKIRLFPNQGNIKNKKINEHNKAHVNVRIPKNTLLRALVHDLFIKS
ncbi:MAG: hypothetical protein K2H64_11900 [Desulfovibrio sp.]|nr:hypothetical protein [Desulfovibrio sp.]